MRKHLVFASLFAAGVAGLVIASSPASAAVVDNFESYSLGNLPLGPAQNWQGAVPALSGGESITVVSNGNNLSGQHLQISTTYPANGISMALPSLLADDGDYVQFAVRLTGGDTYAGMQLLAAGLSDPAARPPGGLGLGTYPAFTSHHVGYYNYVDYPETGDSAWVTGATPANNTWYYMRATGRDTGGAAVIDSYDIQVFDTSMTLLASKLGVPIFGGEGAISYIALVQNEQTGTAVTSVLFDEITIEQIPEPASIGVLAGAALLGLGRRRRV